MFESWDCETNAIAILGDRNWPDNAEVDVDRIGEISFEPHVAMWERAIGHRKSL